MGTFGKDPSVRDDSWHGPFIESLSETGVLAASAKIVGVPRRTVYNHIRDDRAFKKAVKKAIRQAVDTLEGEAWRRARNGVERRRMVGETMVVERVYSDTLLMFLLRAYRPKRFRDQTTINHQGSVGLAQMLAAAEKMRDPDEDAEGAPSA